MARSRTIKPGFFTNDVLAQCEYGARLLFAGLWTISDREGRLEDRPARIKGLLFPFDRCNVEKWLDALADNKFIVRYEAAGTRYIQIVNFGRHQSPHIKEPASLIPAPDSSDTSPLSDSLSARNAVRGNGETGNSNGETGNRQARFVPPTLAEVAAYCLDRNNGIDPEQFIAHYTSKGWKVGRAPMRDWKSAIVTWEKNKGVFSAQPKPARVNAGNTHAPEAAKKDPNYGRL
jgi:hypothetical protein